MKISDITFFLDKLKIKIPENYLKEEIIRFITESKSERLVELPFVLSNLSQKKVKILDIGCRYSILPIQLASLGHKVWGVDIYPYRRKHPNFIFGQVDILKARFPNNYFDMVISISTIEHIGLDFYKEGMSESGDVKAVSKVSKFLRKGGIFIMTAPFGKETNSSWYRVYDSKRIKKLLKNFRISEIKVFKKIDKGYWIPSTIKEVEKIDSKEKVLGAFCVKAIKK